MFMALIPQRHLQTGNGSPMMRPIVLIKKPTLVESFTEPRPTLFYALKDKIVLHSQTLL